MVKRSILIVGLFLLSYAKSSAAESSIFLDQVAEIAFTPKEAFFLLEVDSLPPKRIPAVFVPSPQINRNDTNFEMQRWLIAAQTTLASGTESIKYSAIIKGAQRQLSFLPPKTLSHEERNSAELSASELRDQLISKKEVVQKLEAEREAEEQILQRLRADADVIANIGRIVEVKDESEQIKEELSSLDRDLANLGKFLKHDRLKPPPKNLVGRESQLTNQVAELAQAAKMVEGQEADRRAQAQLDMQRQLELVEATRFEDYDSLQRELVRVRKRRMDLERGTN